MPQAISFLLDSPKADADSSWVQIAKTGKFSDPRYGNFTITTQDFARWVKNFDANIGHGDLGLPVDVDHSPEKKGDTEAMGWVKQLEKRGAELWARVEWNDQGKSLIADRRYAYLSPSYSGNYKDEKGQSHGTALVGIALTNRPFLQMATVNLSAFVFAKGSGGDDSGLDADEVTDLDDSDGNSLSGMDDSDFQNEDGEAECPKGYTDGHALDDVMLNISDAARQNHAVVVKKINGNTRHMFPIPPGDKGHARAALRLLPRAIRAGHITSQEAAAIRQRAAGVLGHKSKTTLSDVPKVVNGEWINDAYSLDQMELDQILTTMGLSRETLGVAADADDTTVLTALKSHNEKPKAPEGHVLLSEDTVTQLQAQAASGAAAAEELRISKFESAFTLAQEAGKVVPAQKDSFREMYDINGDKTLSIIDGLQPVVSMTPQGVGAGVADLEPEARRLAAEYVDTGRTDPMPVDVQGLKVLARAEQIERESNGQISFESAVLRAEAELGVAA